MGNTRNTGYLQNAIKVSDAGAISFMSGSTMLATINTTGQMSGSSPVLFAATASFVANAQTASFVALAQSASNAVSAQTASFANALTVAGTLTAQTLVVQTITSSVDFVTGSTRFGSILGNTHVFSGSVTMNPGGLFVSSSGLVGIGTSNPSFPLEITGNTLISRNQNSLTRLIISNTTAGTGAYVETTYTSDASAGSGAVGKFSSTSTTYKITTASNTYLYNGSTAGDIAILNDFASGTIKMAAGGSSTPHFTIASNGAVTFSSTITSAGSITTAGTLSSTRNIVAGEATPLHLNYTSSDGNGPLMRLGSGTQGFWDVQPSSNNQRLTFEWNDSVNVLNISSSGAVGIGVTNPDTKLEIRSGDIKLSDPSSNINAGYELLWASNNGGTNVSYASIQGITTSAGNRTGDIIFRTGNAGSPAEKMRIRSNGGVSIQGPSSYISMDGGGLSGPPSGLGYGLYPHSGIGLGYYSVAVGHVWYVTATPVSRMYLSTNNLFVGPQQTTSYSERVNIAGGIRIHTGNEWDGVGITATGTRVFYDHTGAEDDIQFQFFSSTRFTLYSNGNYAFTGSNVSDRRLKSNITKITSPYLNKINQLEVSSFTMSSDETNTTKLGFIAQEVKEVLPEIVTGDETKDHEYLGVDTNGLLALAIKAIQEQQAQINELKAQING